MSPQPCRLVLPLQPKTCEPRILGRLDSVADVLGGDEAPVADAMTGPKILDELLEVVPGLRRMRSLNAAMLRSLLDRRAGQCTWCGQPVGRGRSTWCSDQCVEAFKLRCDAQHQARVVEKRDRLICQACGRDIRAAMEDFKAAWHSERDKFSTAGLSWNDSRPIREASNARELELQQAHGWARGHWYEIDHVVPVCEGGGLCGPDGLRLICGACHAKATRELHGRRRRK